ncbi:MAG: hypothetical protein PUP93_20410 [Rhizonema sp. NSF051]|nr:hypothetical protein [Rhizonema sp. NSF051]
MNIATAAQRLKCNPNLIINEMRKKYPGKQWKLETELPQEFVDEMEKHKNEYLDSVEGGTRETPLEEISEDVAEKRDTLATSTAAVEAVQYGILEALTLQEVELSHFFGIATALKGIQSFESSHTQTWELYFQQKASVHSSEIQKLESSILKNALDLQSEMGKRAKSLAEKALDSQMKVEQQKKNFQVLVNAAIGLSTN